MKTIRLQKGLDIPIAGAPVNTVRDGNRVSQVALLGEDYVGMKPTMLVSEGDRVAVGQPLFSDKKNEGVIFTSPGGGTVRAIVRGAKRVFKAVVISVDQENEEYVDFFNPDDLGPEPAAKTIRTLLIKSGLWVALRTRPYGKTPAVESEPSSLFITAADSSPLAAKPQQIIALSPDHFQKGLAILRRMLSVPIHYCTMEKELLECEQYEGIDYWSFSGPHPAGLASTHIHFIDPVHEKKSVWQIGYQDVIAIGHFFVTGKLTTERVISFAGSCALKPGLLRTRIGASLNGLCYHEQTLDEQRVISGSVLDGRESGGPEGFLGRFHDQVSLIQDSSGRSAFNWLLPGSQRFSIRPIFASAWLKSGKLLKSGEKTLPFNTGLWGGKRAIYPLGTYEEVMPLDIIATPLLKALHKGDTEKSKALGCLELIEEDLGLCGFVCPGKNEFASSLRQVLNEIEQGG